MSVGGGAWEVDEDAVVLIDGDPGGEGGEIVDFMDDLEVGSVGGEIVGGSRLGEGCEILWGERRGCG